MNKLEEQRLKNTLNRMNELREKVYQAAVNLKTAKMELASYRKELEKQRSNDIEMVIKKILSGELVL